MVIGIVQFYSQTKHCAPDEMLASYWMMAMSGLVMTRLTAQIPRITSRECRVVSRGVSGCRMLMYLRTKITSQKFKNHKEGDRIGQLLTVTRSGYHVKMTTIGAA